MFIFLDVDEYTFDNRKQFRSRRRCRLLRYVVVAVAYNQSENEEVKVNWFTFL